MENYKLIIGEELFKYLVHKKEVIVNQPDGSSIIFSLDENITYEFMEKAVREAKLKSVGLSDC